MNELEDTIKNYESVILWLWNPILYSELSTKLIYDVLSNSKEKSLLLPLTKTIYLKNVIYLLVYKYGDKLTTINESLRAICTNIHHNKEIIYVLDEKLIGLVKKNLSCLKIEYSLSGEILNNVIKPFANKIKENIINSHQMDYVSKKSHKGYPEPHPEYGLITLEMQECYHKGCHATFSSPEALKKHLIDNNSYIHGMHKSHEYITSVEYGWGFLKPVEIIKKNKLTQCPALICNKKHVIFTTEELIYHFQELGISPYWSPGWKPKLAISEPPKAQINLTEKKEKLIVLSEMMNIIEEGTDSSLCICCLVNRRNIIFFPCNHQIICFDCSKRVESETCLICKEEIKYRFPTEL